MKIKCRCKHCHRLFIPNPRVIDQQYCSQKVCQRARKRHWQRQKMKTDPDYRQNQKKSQKKWRQDNPDYWRNYRKKNPKYYEHNRRKQKDRDTKRGAKRLAKMDALMQEIYIIPNSCTHTSRSCKKGLDGHRPEGLIG